MKILHTADFHFSNNVDKLQEVVRVTDHLLAVAYQERPDCIVIAGDTVDEYDSRIRLDSDCARAAISFIERAADISPVVVIRGTRSHDREAPYLFGHLRGRFPVHVSSDVEIVALLDTGDFAPIDMVSGGNCKAVFTLVPSLDKAALLGRLPAESIKSGNYQFRELVHDLFAGFGLFNEQFNVPTVLVSHGMVTGAQFSSGQMAIGEDLEFGVNDLQASRCDAIMLGHVHKHQAWGNVVYSGSPGRLNFGEQEEKGFVVWEFDGKRPSYRFVNTPARRFVFGETAWEGSGDQFSADLDAAVADCSGADVRFRYTVSDEDRQCVDRAAIEQRFLDAGANRVKIEAQVLPRQRQRAAGISNIDSLPAKVRKWGETVGEDIPADVMAVAGLIEGLEVEELLTLGTEGQAQEQCPDTPDRDSHIPDEQGDLFAGVA